MFTLIIKVIIITVLAFVVNFCCYHSRNESVWGMKTSDFWNKVDWDSFSYLIMSLEFHVQIDITFGVLMASSNVQIFGFSFISVLCNES